MTMLRRVFPEQKLSIVSMTALAVFFLASPAAQAAEGQIHIVGSSTVYPFATAAAEAFGKATGNKTPLVESTGTGGGFKLFCADGADIASASRAIKDSEKKLCADKGIKKITEIKIGFDGIVLANSKKAPRYTLTKEQVFSGLARQVPDKTGALIDNPHQLWSDVDAKLPAVKIEIYGPPTTSGTRDAFTELVMEKSCVEKEAFKKAWADEEDRKKKCQLIREDGHYIEAGENDNLIVQKLESNTGALGLFGYSFLDQNRSMVQGSFIDGVEPTFETIADGSYSISRPLYLYLNTAHQGLGAFAQEVVSDSAAGSDGYLSAKGLIPLPEKDLQAMQKIAAEIK